MSGVDNGALTPQVFGILYDADIQIRTHSDHMCADELRKFTCELLVTLDELPLNKKLKPVSVTEKEVKRETKKESKTKEKKEKGKGKENVKPKEKSIDKSTNKKEFPKVFAQMTTKLQNIANTTAVTITPLVSS